MEVLNLLEDSGGGNDLVISAESRPDELSAHPRRGAGDQPDLGVEVVVGDVFGDGHWEECVECVENVENREQLGIPALVIDAVYIFRGNVIEKIKQTLGKEPRPGENHAPFTFVESASVRSVVCRFWDFLYPNRARASFAASAVAGSHSNPRPPLLLCSWVWACPAKSSVDGV